MTDAEVFNRYKKRFEHFLKAKGIRAQYYQHTEASEGEVWAFIDSNNPESWINGAFGWEETDEGVEFWMRIDQEWYRQKEDEIYENPDLDWGES